MFQTQSPSRWNDDKLISSLLMTRTKKTQHLHVGYVNVGEVASCWASNYYIYWLQEITFVLSFTLKCTYTQTTFFFAWRRVQYFVLCYCWRKKPLFLQSVIQNFAHFGNNTHSLAPSNGVVVQLRQPHAKNKVDKNNWQSLKWEAPELWTRDKFVLLFKRGKLTN